MSKSKVSGITPSQYRDRSMDKDGIAHVLQGAFRPYHSACQPKVRYSFNRALNAASNIWERGDFLSGSISVASADTSMSAIRVAQEVVLGESGYVFGVANQSDKAGGTNISVRRLQT